MADKIVYFELAAGQNADLAKFYGQVFGWGFTPSDSGYLMCKAGEGIDGGIAPQHSHNQPVLIYIAVEDIDAKLRQIEAAGGKVVIPKTCISAEYGDYAVFTDPSGVTVGICSGG